MQNKIQQIEGLDGLAKLRNLELAANRIRVRVLPEVNDIKVDCDTGSGEFGDSDRFGGAVVRKE